MNEELKIIISAEVAKLKKGIADAKKQMTTFKQKATKAIKDVSEEFNKMSEGVKSAAKKIGVGIAAMGTALLANVSATEEYRNQQAQLATAFETAGSSADAAAQTYNDLYRVLGDSGQATEAAQHLALLTQNEKDLAQWTDITKGVYATFGASLPIESLTEAANETAKNGELTGALSDALVWAGVSEEAFQEKLNACNTEAEREALIRTTLNGLYSEAATNYENNNAKILAQRDAQAALQERLAILGETLAPVITAFTQLATTVLEQLTPHIQTLAEQFMPQLQTVLQNVGTAIGNIIGWVVNNWEMITTIGGIILGIATAFSIMSGVMNIANGVMTLLSMNPITLAIGALVAAIALCIIHWEDISAAAEAAWNWIVSVWNSAGEWFAGIWENIKGAFANVGSWFKDTFEKARKGVENAWNNIGEWFADIWSKIQNAFRNVDSWMTDKFGDAWLGIKQAFQPFVNFFKQIWETVKGIFSVVGSVLTGNFSDAWEGIKNIFSGWGSFFSGLWDSITKIFTNIGQAIGNAISGTVKKAVNAVLSVAVGIINGFISAINFAIDVINLIPGVNIGKIRSLSVPAMAKGGVVDSATLAVIGEQGKEAVVPLENNLEWLNKLAGMLNDRMGGGNKPIILNVDGKTFAQTSIDTINQLTKQTGSLGLAII